MWDAGENPPDGVMIHYYLKEAPEEITVTILDGGGQVIRSFSSKCPRGGRRQPGTPRAQGTGHEPLCLEYALPRGDQGA